MDDNHTAIAGDAIERDALDLAEAGRDLAGARVRELEISTEEASVDAQIAELNRRKAALEAEKGELRGRELTDEDRIAKDLRAIDGELGVERGCGQSGAPQPAKHYDFTVDSKQYRTDQPRLTGLQIKAKVAEWDPSHDLVQEGAGHEPDRIVGDGDVVDFASAVHPLHFSSAPKANFG